MVLIDPFNYDIDLSITGTHAEGHEGVRAKLIAAEHAKTPAAMQAAHAGNCLNQFAKNMNFDPASYQMKEYVSRLSSCAPAGTIAGFNVKLV